jgi:hypothetical protein
MVNKELNNIYTNPAFEDSIIGDYRLRGSSPCIDAGIQDTLIVYNEGSDTLNIPPMYYIGSAPDLGAYEYGDPSLIRQESISLTNNYSLNQNYPNPFNPTTMIEFHLEENSHVFLQIYNIEGRLVSTLIDKKMTIGNHRVEFNANNLANGIYIYQIKVGKFQDSKKMILLK